MGEADIQAALRDMARSIGGLESTVKTLTSTWQQQDAAASEGRRELHRKFEAMSEKVSALQIKVETILADIVEMKPTIETVQNAEQQAVGAGKLGKGLWVGLTLLTGGVGYVLSHWVDIAFRK